LVVQLEFGGIVGVEVVEVIVDVEVVVDVDVIVDVVGSNAVLLCVTLDLVTFIVTVFGT
jgi:hypothetical protein